MAVRIEELGYHSAWLFDHLISPVDVSSSCPRASDGDYAMEATSPCLEAVTLLAALAARTERIRLGTRVLVPLLRHPVVLAKELATIDAIAGGRLVLGVGTGWMREEFDAVDVPMDRRLARLDEHIGQMQQAWRHDVSRFDGTFYSHALAGFHPQPPQPGNTIPVLIGGIRDAALRRVARYGGGWAVFTPPTGSSDSHDPLAPEVLRERLDVLRRFCDEEGRDFAELVIRHQRTPVERPADLRGARPARRHRLCTRQLRTPRSDPRARHDVRRDRRHRPVGPAMDDPTDDRWTRQEAGMTAPDAPVLVGAAGIGSKERSGPVAGRREGRTATGRPSSRRDDMTPEHLDVSIDGHVATITLDRPHTLNAFTLPMFDGLVGVLDRLDSDDDVRAIIVTGAGRGFCSGRDISGGASAFDKTAGPDPSTLLGYRELAARVTLRIFDLNKPVIAAVNGPAIGFGATLTLAMDVRLAARSARFGFVFTRRGLVPEGASSWFLPRLVGMGRAQDWMCTGRTVSAEEACAAGLVRSVLPDAALLPDANALALEIAEAAPISVALTRRLLWRMQGATHPAQASRLEAALLFTRGRSADAVEGVEALRERRAPRFPMRLADPVLEGVGVTGPDMLNLAHG
ncbi:MAG: TIGR03619 family F420-dependent LLM class oxidoreductase [Pseudonocardia sp.]|nr:TIGR03619 family F420-dependent LLM class oxidoreductase [Pseudonocardia sp.]